MPPLERHPLLRPLSREHHEGLLLCWRIRRDLVARTDLEQVFEECRAFFHSDLLPHFAVEEEVVFPVLGSEHPGRFFERLGRPPKACEEHSTSAKAEG